MHPCRPSLTRLAAALALSQACSGMTQSGSGTTGTENPSPPVAVTVAPSTAAVNGCMSAAFTSQVAGSSNTALTWSVQEGAAGGAVTSAGVYTAPAAAGTYHVVATSAADPTKSASAAVTVTTKVLGVSVSPGGPAVQTGGTVMLTATVTTTCGSFVSTQEFAVADAEQTAQ